MGKTDKNGGGDGLGEDPVIIEAQDYVNMANDEETGNGKPKEKKSPKTGDYSAFADPVVVTPSSGAPSDFNADQNNFGHETEKYKSHDPYVGSTKLGDGNKLRKCNDGIWGVLFVLHILYLVHYTRSNYGVRAVDVEGYSYRPQFEHAVFLVIALSVLATVASTVSLGSMMKHADSLVKAALVVSISTSLILGIGGFILGEVIIGLMGFTFFVIGACYARVIWPRIPYTLANLRTAISAIRLNLGILFIAYIVLAVAVVFCSIFVVGIHEAIFKKHYGVVLIWMISYYWVHQLLQNILHVTVSGVIGAWWFHPEDSPKTFWFALLESLCRSLSFGFGSICFGSFVVAPIKAIRSAMNYSRKNKSLKIFVCFLECITYCVDSIIEYFNKWAYIYIGLYGYSYLDAGRNALSLFEQKGWTVLVTDDLIDNVNNIICLFISLMTGFIGLGLSHMYEGFVLSTHGFAGFFIGFLVGYMISNTLFSVVASSVNTVIVCYVECPSDFHKNHPTLSAEMREAWQTAWPEVS